MAFGKPNTKDEDVVTSGDDTIVDVSVDELEEELGAEQPEEQIEEQPTKAEEPAVMEQPKEPQDEVVIYVSAYPQLTAYANVGKATQLDPAGNEFQTSKTRQCLFMNGVFQTSDKDIIKSLDMQAGMHFRRASKAAAEQMMDLATKEHKMTETTEKGTAGSVTKQAADQVGQTLLNTQKQQEVLFNAADIEGLPPVDLVSNL